MYHGKKTFVQRRSCVTMWLDSIETADFPMFPIFTPTMNPMVISYFDPFSLFINVLASFQ